MKPQFASPRAFARALAAALALLAGGAATASAADPVDATIDLSAPAPEASPQVEHAQAQLRDSLGARGLVEPDPDTGSPKLVARLNGFLTPASTSDPADVALGYVAQHRAAFGLEEADLAGFRETSRTTGDDGTTYLSWEQQTDGIPNVDGGLKAAVSDDGRLINVTGGPLGAPGGGTSTPAIGARRAFEAATPGGAPAPPATDGSGPDRRTRFLHSGEASLVRFRDGDEDRLGWRVLAPEGSQAFYDAIVDARTGKLIRRVNRVRSDSSIRHYDVNPRAPGDSTVVSPVPDEWLGTTATLNGQYVHAVTDLNDQIKPVPNGTTYSLSRQPNAGDEVPPTTQSGSDRAWTVSPQLGLCDPIPGCSWSGSNPTANRAFTTAQLFWYANTFRDHLAASPIDFTGAQSFAGDDPVIAQALDGATLTASGPDAAHRSNANMLVLPSPFPGLMQMYLFGSAAEDFGRYDGAMDAGMVYHEYAHGLSERLVTDAQGFGALIGAQPGAIAEGNSDFFAMDYLVQTEPGLDGAAQGDVQFGKFLQPNIGTKGVNGIRTEGLDCPVPVTPPSGTSPCPGTPWTAQGGYRYSDFGRIRNGPEPHADGEIWAQTLWSIRAALIAAHGGGDGLDRTRSYITEGLRLAPENPTFLDMRNAIVQAAWNENRDEDWNRLWDVFAIRGMGWWASTEGPDDTTPEPNFDPTEDTPDNPSSRGTITGRVVDENGAAVAGANVAIAGHDSGIPGDTGLSAATDPSGRYTLSEVPSGQYPDLYASKPGYAQPTTAVSVQGATTAVKDFNPFRRDWASLSSGGAATTDGPNYSAYGCGPAQAVDDNKNTVWSTTATGGPHNLVIDLGRAVNLSAVRIDPRAGCGDDAAAALSSYSLAASDGPGKPFEQIAGGILGSVDTRGYVTVPLGGDLGGRRLLRLTALAPRSLVQDAAQPFVDVSEVEVSGDPAPAPPTATPTPQPTPTVTPEPPQERTTPTTLLDAKLKATRKGMVKIRVSFGNKAPAGSARLRILGRRSKPIAEGLLTVRPSRTATKTIRLTKRGRKQIRPGKTKTVKLELRLPGGLKVKQTLKLARAKR